MRYRSFSPILFSWVSLSPTNDSSCCLIPPPLRTCSFDLGHRVNRETLRADTVSNVLPSCLYLHFYPCDIHSTKERSEWSDVAVRRRRCYSRVSHVPSACRSLYQRLSAEAHWDTRLGYVCTLRVVCTMCAALPCTLYCVLPTTTARCTLCTLCTLHAARYCPKTCYCLD